MSGQMTIRLPDGTVTQGGAKSSTPFYDAVFNSDPARFMWLVGLGPYPGPLPKPPQEDTETSAPGTEPATPAPAVPPAGEGAGKLALPGAEDDVQDEPEPPQEELPLEPLPEPVCGLVSNGGETCGRRPGHEGGHGPAEESAA